MALALVLLGHKEHVSEERDLANFQNGDPMKTYPLEDKNGYRFGFEIESIYFISTKKICKTISTITGVSNIECRSLLIFSAEYHVVFDYLGDQFVVHEPHSDSSRYWIYPKEAPARKIDFAEIENAFIQYNPPILIKLFGDLMTLKFLKSTKS